MKQQPSSGTGGAPSRLLLRYALAIVLVLVVQYLVVHFFSGSDSVVLPYSDFRELVTEGKIEEVTFQGQEIRGRFGAPYHRVVGGDSLSFNHFTSTAPPFEDPTLTEDLKEARVTVRAEEESGGWLGTLLIFVVPWLLVIGYFVLIRRRMQQQMGGMMGGGLFSVGRSRAKRFAATHEATTFNDVAGLANAKQDLREIIEYLKEPAKFARLGADIPNGVLLMGPPGTGKTLLARATAGEAGVAFFSISGSEFIEMFVGVGASRVRDMFETAKKEAPSVIFIDEIDSVGRTRGTGLGGGHDEREQTLNQILSEMDGFEKNQSVVVMAATNRPDVLDPALTRPGRFDRQVTLELPHREARKHILEIHVRNVPLAKDVDLGLLAGRTVGFSGAELKNLVNEAALLAGRKQREAVTVEDFDEARDKLLLGAEREELLNEEEKKVIAYHEAGHAMMARILPDTDPLQKVTIIPRGRALGATEQVPAIERHNIRRGYLLNRIAVTLGGRAAERVVFNEVSNGAAADLKQVTRLARLMVCQWGMSDRIGPVYYPEGEEHPFLGKEIAQPKTFSEETARTIDAEIHRILSEQEQRALETLTSRRDDLDALAAALLEHETLDREMVDGVLGTRAEADQKGDEKRRTAHDD